MSQKEKNLAAVLSGADARKKSVKSPGIGKTIGATSRGKDMLANSSAKGGVLGNASDGRSTRGQRRNSKSLDKNRSRRSKENKEPIAQRKLSEVRNDIRERRIEKRKLHRGYLVRLVGNLFSMLFPKEKK